MGSNAREGIVGDFNGPVGLNLLGKPLKGFGSTGLIWPLVVLIGALTGS